MIQQEDTFRKRQKSLLKKLAEISTLCQIPACAVIYSPYDSQPEVWPSPEGVQQLVSQFKMIPEMEQTKKLFNQESFLGQRISKAKEQLGKQREKNREDEVTQVMFQSLAGKSLTHLNILDLNDISWVIDKNLKEITQKTETQTINPSYGGASSAVGESSVAGGYAEGTLVVSELPETVVVAEPLETVGFDMYGESVQSQQWFMDLINPRNQFRFSGSMAPRDGMLLPFSDQNQTNAGGVDEMLLPLSDQNQINAGGEDEMLLRFSDRNQINARDFFQDDVAAFDP